MSSSHNDDDDDDRPIQPAQHRRRLVTQTGGKADPNEAYIKYKYIYIYCFLTLYVSTGSSDGGTGETTSASGRLGCVNFRICFSLWTRRSYFGVMDWCLSNV